MEDKLRNSLLNICKLLEKYNINYIIVGGTAVAKNWYNRYSINNAGEKAIPVNA